MSNVMRKLTVVMLALAVLLSFTPVMSGQVFAGGGSANVDVTPAASYVNATSPYVRLTWSFNSSFVSGTYVERYDKTKNVTNNVGNVGSTYSYTRFDDTGIEAGSTYRYRLVNGSNISNWSEDVVVPKEESGPDSGSGEEGGGSGGETVTPPDIQNLTISSVSKAPGVATISGNGYYTDPTYLEVKTGGKVVMDIQLQGYFERNVSIPYNQTTVFECRIYTKDSSGNKVYAEKYYTLTQKSQKLGKVGTLYATRINANKASLVWSGVNGATGFEVYYNNKKIKTLKKKTSFTYSKKGAGKGKYKIVPYFTQSRKTYKGGAKTAKTAANVAKFSGYSLNPKSYKVLTCKFIVTKVELTGKTYKVTGYAINGSHYTTCTGYKSLQITLKQNGKTVAGKKFRKNFKVKPLSKKKMTFTINGKPGKDIRGMDFHWSTKVTEKW